MSCSARTSVTWGRLSRAWKNSISMRCWSPNPAPPPAFTSYTYRFVYVEHPKIRYRRPHARAFVVEDQLHPCNEPSARAGGSGFAWCQHNIKPWRHSRLRSSPTGHPPGRTRKLARLGFLRLLTRNHFRPGSGLAEEPWHPGSRPHFSSHIDLVS